MSSQIVQVGMALAQALALIMSSAFVAYVVIILWPFLRHRPSPPGNSAAFDWHIFVPALNEELVIGGTVTYLRDTFPAAHVWLIDDDSQDGTASIARELTWADPLVHLVSRRLPDARTGKGATLNSAYQALNDWLPVSADRSRIIVGVVDADGRPSPDCLDVCAGGRLFGDGAVGSVQVTVRMLNRHDRVPFPRAGRLANLAGHVLVQMQDLEFRVPIAAIQETRIRTRTVGLGGNGQFSRLSALDTVTDERGPWRGTLLEDYELSLHLMLAGHRNEFTLDTHVDQEGLPDIRKLLRQRTRWGQGTMQCGRYLPRLWTSRHVSIIGALEATYYLFQPWMQVVGALIYPVPLAIFLANYAAGPAAMQAWTLQGAWPLILLYCAFGLGPFVIMGPLYVLRWERELGFARALGLGLAYSAYIFIFYVTSWRAFTRIVRHRREWTKTPRNAAARPAIHARRRSAAVGGIQVITEIMGERS